MISPLQIDEIRAGVWQIIRRDKIAHIADICKELQLDAATIRDYIRGLIAAKYISGLPKGGKSIKPAVELLNDTGLEAPRVGKFGNILATGSGRQKIWEALGIYAQRGHRFTVKELTLLITIKEADALQYLEDLLATGILTKMTGQCGRPDSYYIGLKKWTGPKAPQVQRIRAVYDPNSRTMTPLKVITVEWGGK